MLTARADSQSIDAAFGAGVSDYIPKPVNIHVLEHRVRTLITARRHEVALEQMVAERTQDLQRLNTRLREELAERTRVEAALRASELRFQVAADSSLDAFSILESVRDESGQIVDFIYADLNVRAEQLSGRSRDEMRGKRLSDALPIAFTNAWFEQCAQVVETRQVLEAEIPVHSPPINAQWVHQQIVPTPNGAAVTMRDITRQKQLEAELQHERDLLHMLLNNVPDAIYFKDTASRFTRINRAHAHLLGISDESVAVDKTDGDFFPAAHAEATGRDEQHLLATGTPLVDSIEHIDASAEPMFLSTTKVPLRDAEGMIVGLVSISRDITDRVDAVRELRVRDQAIACRRTGSLSPVLRNRTARLSTRIPHSSV